jgi:hypothetical protein
VTARAPPPNAFFCTYAMHNFALAVHGPDAGGFCVARGCAGVTTALRCRA